MIRQLTFATVFLLNILSFNLNAQELDTLVYFDEITYSSPFEEEVFKGYFVEDKQDYLALFFALDKDITKKDYDFYKNHFDVRLAEIDVNKLNSKSEKKKIKTIYGEVHTAFLKKYEYQNKFSSIFSKGYYNCVSGSALYGIVFDKLDIPYIVREKPTHVYLMTYPETERILVEPTDPQSGYLVFNNVYKSTFVENLKSAKIIGSDEAKNSTTDELFDKYYFADVNITIKELVGIQYTNDALYKIEKQEYEEAYHQLEKAYLFYPTEKVASLLFVINAELISKSQYTDIRNASYLAKLTRHKRFGIENENIMAEFVRANNILLIDKNDKENYTKFYESFISQVSDTALVDEVSFIYNYENGRVLYNKGNYEESLSYLGAAFSVKPENHDINNLFVSAIGQGIRFQSDNKMALQNLEKYKEDYPKLMDNNNFKSMIVNAYLLQSFYSYDLNKPAEGSKYKDLFKQNYSSDLTIDISMIGRAYSNAAIYYFRKGNKAKAMALINEGLDIVPNNHELLMRKKMIH